MTCPDAREQLSALLDDALDAAARQSLEAHLAGCADCRRELAALRGTVALLGRLRPAHAPAGFVDRVTAAVDRPSWPRRLFDAVFRPLRVKLPLEAAAVLLVGVSAVYVYQRTPEVREVARQEAREAPVPPIPAPAPSAPAVPAPAPSSPPAAAGPAIPAPAPAPSAPQSRPAQPRPARPPSQPEVAARARQVPAEAPAPATPAPPAPASSDTRDSPAATALGKTAESEAKKETLAASRADAPAPLASPGAEEKVKVGEPSAPRDALGAGSRRSAASPAKPPEAAAPLPDARGGAGGAAGNAAQAPVARSFMRAVDASGRLAVPAREPAESALDALLERLGARRVARRLEGDQSLVLIDVLVPAARYPELIEGLGRIGRWVTEYESRTLPAEVRVEVAIRVEP